MSPDRPFQLRKAMATLAKRRDDKTAWTEVYNALAPRATAAAFRFLGGDRAAAQDACHDAFVRLFRSADFSRLADDDELGRYFSVIVRNVCLDSMANRGKAVLPNSDGARREYGNSDADGHEIEHDNAAQPSSAEFAELEQHIDEAMSKVGPPERVLISLLRKGYTLSEVAARLGVSYENAGIRVHRLRSKLRALWR